MYKAILLEATCRSDVVKVENYPVQAAEVLSQGKGASTGLLIMFGDKAYYIPNAAEDLKTTIEKTVDLLTSLNEALTKIGTTLTSIGAGMTGPTTAPPPTLAADVVEINSKVTALNAVKSSLNTLKGALK